MHTERVNDEERQSSNESILFALANKWLSVTTVRESKQTNTDAPEQHHLGAGVASYSASHSLPANQTRDTLKSIDVLQQLGFTI